MTEVYVGVGSNIDCERNIASGLTALQSHFGELRLSPVYQSEAIGFSGDDFLNLVVGFDTALSVGELSDILRTIERVHGRADNAPKFSPRSLDLDILLFGDLCGTVDGVTLPRAEVLYNAFVLRPLADLAPTLTHPENGKTFAALWQQLSVNTEQRLALFRGLA